MKKYRVSKRLKPFFIISAVLWSLAVVFFTWLLLRYGSKNAIGATIVTALSGLGCLYLCLYSISRFFKDYITGTFSFDEKGITVYTLRHSRFYSWDEFIEYGFTKWIGGGKFAYSAYNYFVYCSRRHISENERDTIFRADNRKNADEYILFQYSPEVFDEFVKYIPDEKYREILTAQKNRLKLNWREKRMNN